MTDVGELPVSEQDRALAETVAQVGPRLRRFIRRRVLDDQDAEDVLQDVFYELTEAYRMLRPAERMTAWLFRVARNRVTDLWRRRKTLSLQEPVLEQEDGGGMTLEDLLPSREAGPDAAFARSVLLDAVEEALDELPPEQRAVFVAHEVLGKSFREIVAETGVGMNTLLSRKRYAVLHLRERLKEMEEMWEVKR